MVILDRPRHDELVAEVREAGARVLSITDGDVAGAIATAWPNSGADILFGIGGTPEGVIAAAALKGLGGEIQGVLHARDDAEQRDGRGAGLRLRARPHDRRPRRRRQLLLLGDGDHRRRLPARRAVPRLRRDDPVHRRALAARAPCARSRRSTATTSSRNSPPRGSRPPIDTMSRNVLRCESRFAHLASHA